MKRRVIISMVILMIFFLCLIPEKAFYSDGGTVQWKSIIYSITKYNAIIEENEYMVGYEVEVFGITIYDNTHIIKTK
ncbi:MAG: hypothetical protein IJD97_09845 [Clostridia bacterium]|nr:hypothetical protein [Clostridia bacterium]